MSGESILHVRLVEALERHVRREHAPERGLLLLLDHDRYGSDRPHRCGGFCPDLFASDLPSTFEIIGEAKTPADIERPHTRSQLAGFLDHLSLQAKGFLYLCVPRFSMPRAQAFLVRLRRPEHARVTIAVVRGD